MTTTTLLEVQLLQMRELEQVVQLLIAAAQEEHTVELRKKSLRQVLQAIGVQVEQLGVMELHGKQPPPDNIKPGSQLVQALVAQVAQLVTTFPHWSQTLLIPSMKFVSQVMQ